MKINRFQREQVIPSTIEKAWEFFSNPRNLSLITPPEMNFVITNKIPEKIYPGLIITYKVSPLPLLRVDWMTQIVHAVENQYFIDEQRIGPYKLWYHIHQFEEVQNGILIRDIVYYVIPFGIVGNTLAGHLVKKKLEYIFDYRKDQISKIFAQKTYIAK